MQETVGHAPSSSASVAATLFDSRKVAKPDADDPFGEAASAVLKDMKKGMEDLLSMMNLHELASLCGALGLPNAGPHVERQARVLGYIRAGGRQSAEKRFAQVLRLTWEGLLFEYLRYVGHPLHSARTDPRLAVLRYWRRSTLAPGGAGANFVPYYLERQIKARSAITKLDPDIERIRVTLGEHETSVKLTEGKIRKDNDYRHVLDLMAANKRLHKYALESVEYLSRELETSRAQLDHSMETAAMLEENVVEIEQTLNDAMVKSEAAQAEKKAQADRAHAALAQVQASSAVAISTVKAILDDDMEGQGGEPELDSLQTSLAALRGAHLNIVQRHQEECTRLREAMLSLKDETDQAKSEAEATRAQLTAARAEAFVWKEGVETLSRRLDNQLAASRMGQKRSERRLKSKEDAIQAAASSLMLQLSSFSSHESSSALHLLQTLGVGRDSYAHILETKNMLKADLESRAAPTLSRLARAGKAKAGSSSVTDKGKTKAKGKVAAVAKGKSPPRSRSPKASSKSKPQRK